jgi:hypothetical protein
MLRIVTVAFAALVSSAAVAPSFATTQQSVIEPVRMCFEKFCDPTGKCTYRPKACPRSRPLQ